MPGNTFGHLFRITTAGESHGPGNVVIIDGVPPGIELSAADLMPDLRRRRPGQSKVTTQRKEDDKPEILSGVFEGRTTGTSLAILIRNQDQRSGDYSEIKDKYRPGHADYTFDAKYGFRDYRGGGRSSAKAAVTLASATSAGRVGVRTTSCTTGGWPGRKSRSRRRSVPGAHGMSAVWSPTAANGGRRRSAVIAYMPGHPSDWTTKAFETHAASSFGSISKSTITEPSSRNARTCRSTMLAYGHATISASAA